MDYRDYSFKDSISREVLNNYLSRAVTHACLLDAHEGSVATFEDDLGMLTREGAKFIGRAAYVWGVVDDAEHFGSCRERAALCHRADPELMLQCCVFECVYRVFCENTPIPRWVFEAFGQPFEGRCFSMDKMCFPDGRFLNLWGNETTVPNIMTLEGQMWIYYRACMYIACGCEAIHFGQVWLIGALDPGWAMWRKVVGMVREYAATHARRGYVVCDAHCHGLICADGYSVLDFNSFPLRLREIEDQPMKCRLEEGYLDSLFNRSRGGLHPSGWKADPLPFLVEYDNFGVSDTPGKATPDSHYAWGYDEITWFALQPAAYRAEFLRYADVWVNERYPEGWVQMPSKRILAGAGNMRLYFANSPSENCPGGFGDEAVIRDIWHGRG